MTTYPIKVRFTATYEVELDVPARVPDKELGDWLDGIIMPDGRYNVYVPDTCELVKNPDGTVKQFQ